MFVPIRAIMYVVLFGGARGPLPPGAISVRVPQLVGMALGVGGAMARFKVNVRKLKSVGLTESLEIGYRLSPRGTALLRLLP